MKKKTCEFIKSNGIQIIEVFALIGAIILPFLPFFPDIFKKYLENTPPTLDNMLWHIALRGRNYIASAILFVFLLVYLRKKNANMVMNRKYCYHDYSYAWYWFCAKLLGIKQCNLILVPIQMQFKLVLRSTFSEYPLNDDDFPVIDGEIECITTITHDDKNWSELNLILNDTYVIEERQIPKKNRDLFTITVSQNKESNDRCYNRKLVKSTNNALRKYEQISVVNVYATTNPKNTLHIVKQVFGSVSRGNIDHLYVFQQRKDEKRTFGDKGYKIF